MENNTKTEIGEEKEGNKRIKSYTADFIKSKFEPFLQNVKQIKEIKNLNIDISNKEILIDATVVSKGFNIEVQVVIENKGDGIAVKSHNIDAKWPAKGIAEEAITPHLGKISEMLKTYMEKEEEGKIEKIWIENGELKAMFANDKIEKVEATEIIQKDETKNNKLSKLEKEEEITFTEFENEKQEEENKNEKVFEFISDQEYEDFVDNNKVSEVILNRIAEKIKRSEKLSLREQAIHSSKTTEIEEKIKTEGKNEENNPIKNEISEEDIRKKAQEIYEKRLSEGRGGNEQTDWEEAENELRGGKENKDESEEKELTPEKIESLEEMLSGLEKEAKDKLENGPLTSKMKGLVLSGLDKWENFGKGEEGIKGFAKRFSKMAVNLALIGAISSISVQELAKMGVGTATALSGGVMSKLATKMSVGLGIGGIMEVTGNKIPDKIKKWMPAIMGVIGTGTAFAITGGAAGVVAGLSAGVGYVGSKYIGGKYTNEKIDEREKEAKQNFLLLLKEREKEGEIDFNKIDQIKNDYNKILKKYENQRTWAKLEAGAGKLGVGALISGISMEVSGLHHDSVDPQQINTTEIKTTEPSNIIENTNIITEPATPEHLKIEAVADNGQGAISTLRELQGKLKIEYGDNLDNAPENVKHILNTDAHKLAQEYGMYKPGEDAESAKFLAGDKIIFDKETGEIIFDKVKSDTDFILQKGNEVHEYKGEMSDTDHSGLETNDADKYKLPEQTNPNVEQSDLTNDKYKLPEQTNPETEKQIESSLEKSTTHNIRGEILLNSKGDEIITTEPLAGLSTEDLHKVYVTFHENINHLFPTDKLMESWDLIKRSIPADRLMELYGKGEVTPEYNPLIEHIKKLEEITGFKPISENAITFTPAESITHFINRAMEKIQLDGKLDQIKL